MLLAHTLLILGNLVVLVPVGVFSAEVALSLLPTRKRSATALARPTVAVIVPAHDEAADIRGTVSALRTQLRAGDRLVVVADNCSDDTARLAELAGAEVVVRTDPDRRGKGFALDFGVRHLAAAPPEVVIIVDADCRPSPGSVDHLAAVASTGRPAQALYLMSTPHDADVRVRVAELAFLVKNHVRPAGLQRLGFGCQLTGSGMAFPWPIIRAANLAHGSLVEDMQLGVDLALAGTPAQFCPEARIGSDFPQTATGIASQRSRWEEGHLGMIARALALLPRAIAMRNLAAVALLVDIMVPPLTLLLLLSVASLAATALLTVGLGLAPHALGIASLNCLLVGAPMSAAWCGFGRKVLPARELLSVFPYILSKFRLYRALGSGKRSAGWVRTDRKRGGDGH